MSLGLAKNGRQLVLDPDFSIDWEVEDDLIDFDSLSQGYSWTSLVPIKGNEWAFGYASDPSNVRNQFKTYDGFSISVDGNVWWFVSVDLLRCNPKVTHYEINITTIESIVSQKAKTKIADLLDAEFTITNFSTWQEISDLYNTSTSGILFPSVHFMHTFQFNDKLNMLLPAFRIKFLLSELTKSLGYTFIDNFTSSAYDHNKLCIMYNRVIADESGLQKLGDSYSFIRVGGETKRVGDYISPDIELYAFFQQVAFLTASNIDIDPENKQIIFSGIARELNTNKSLNLKEKLSEKVAAEQPKISNLKLEFSNLDKDFLLAEEGNFSGYNYNGEFLSAANMDLLSGTLSDRDYSFCQLENSYFSFTTDYGIQFLGDAFQEISTGNENEKTISIDWLPARKERFFYKKYDVDFDVTDNGSGKVRITATFPSAVYNPGTNSFIKLDQSKLDVAIYPDIYHDITSANFTSGNIISYDLDLDYIVDINGTGLVSRTENDKYQPVIGDDFQIPEYGINGNKSFVSRVFFFHGMVDNIDQTETYPLASCDPYDNQGNKIGNYGLRFHQSENFFNAVWKPVHDYIKESRILKFTGYLSSTLLKKLASKTKKATYHKGRFRFRRFRASLTSRGIEDQEIEGYSL